MAGRRWSVVGSAIGIGVALPLWLALAHVLPPQPAEATAGRLALACAALLPAACVLTLMIAAQMGLRAWSGAVDPLAGCDDRRLLVNQRALSNTVEQLAVFAIALLALAAQVAPEQMCYVVAAGLVFALARIAFWAGYLIGPLMRAPGMAASFAINLTTLAAAVWQWWPRRA